MKLPGAAAIAASVMFLVIWTGCGNTFRPVAVPIEGPTPSSQNRTFAMVLSAEMPGTPGDVLTTCVLSGLTPPCPGAISQIDVSGDVNLGNQTVGIVTENASNSLTTPVKTTLFGQQAFVANSFDNTVSAFYPTVSTAATTISLPAASGGGTTLPLAPVVATFTPAGQSTPTSQLYVPAYDTGQVFVVNQSTNTLLTTLTVGTNPISATVAVGGLKVYVVNQGSNSVTAISTPDNTVNPLTGANIPVGTGPLFAVTNTVNGLIYVLNGDSTISTIDPSTDTLAAPATTPRGGVSGATFMAFDPTLLRLYVPNTRTNNVTVYDGSGASLTELGSSPLTVGSAPVAAAPLPDGSKVYVVNTGDTSGCNVSVQGTLGTVSVISSSTNTVTCVTVGQTPVWVAASTDSSRVYVAHQGYHIPTSTTGGPFAPNTGAPGTTIIQTSNNLFVTDVAAPVANSDACVANSAPCIWMKPFYIVTSD